MIRKMQVKIPMRYNYTRIRMSKTEKTGHTSVIKRLSN